MTGRIRKWLASEIKLSLTWGEVLVIAALVVVINAIWPDVPTWVFIIIGAVIGVAKAVTGDIRHWLRRRRAA